MTTLLRFSCQLYARLLFLYPDELRQEFASEMTSVFAEDLATAASQRGVTGIAGAFWCTLTELARLALPAQLENRAIAAPLMAFALAALCMTGELMLAARHVPDQLRSAMLRDSFSVFVLL